MSRQKKGFENTKWSRRPDGLTIQRVRSWKLNRKLRPYDYLIPWNWEPTVWRPLHTPSVIQYISRKCPNKHRVRLLLQRPLRFYEPSSASSWLFKKPTKEATLDYKSVVTTGLHSPSGCPYNYTMNPKTRYFKCEKSAQVDISQLGRLEEQTYAYANNKAKQIHYRKYMHVVMSGSEVIKLYGE